VAYIGAIWSASFVGADRLALTFYEELLERKQPLGLALKNGKMRVKKKRDPNCEWANFIFYGDPSLIIRL